MSIRSPRAFDFAPHMRAVALHLLGEPSQQTKTELRFGTHGSMCIDLIKGVFFDNETGKGGGVLDLIRREKGVSGGGAINFLRTIGCGPDDPPPKKIVATYDYTDEHGAILFQVVRYDPKDFGQRKPNGRGGWEWNVKGVRPVPYRLPELIAAVKLGRELYLTEGEKDSDAMVALGLAATTCAGGANKWRAELNSHFVGADVVILPHNDAAGRKHEVMVASQLSGVAAKVRVLSLAPFKDAFDWIAAGGTAEKLRRLVETQATEPPKPEPPPPPSKPQIVMEPGCGPRMVTEAEDALINAGEEIYRRGSLIVRPVLTDCDAPDRRKTFVWKVREVTPAYLSTASQASQSLCGSTAEQRNLSLPIRRRKSSIRI